MNNSRIRLRFEESYLKQEKWSKFFYSLWIRYMVTRFKWWFYSKRLLFGSVKTTKNADPDKYSYSGYGIGFDSRSHFILIGVKMLSSLELVCAHLRILIIKEKIS